MSIIGDVLAATAIPIMEEITAAIPYGVGIGATLIGVNVAWNMFQSFLSDQRIDAAVDELESDTEVELSYDEYHDQVNELYDFSKYNDDKDGW